MKKALLISALLPLVAWAADGFKMVKSQELKDIKATYVDANNQDTRANVGVIPGAKILSSSSKYAATELPTNKKEKLVFYCYNEDCMASHKAAKRAMEFGYTDVSVMSDGVMGWKNSGFKLEKKTN